MNAIEVEALIAAVLYGIERINRSPDDYQNSEYLFEDALEDARDLLALANRPIRTDD